MNARQRRTLRRTFEHNGIHICSHCYLVMPRSRRHSHDCVAGWIKQQEALASQPTPPGNDEPF